MPPAHFPNGGGIWYTIEAHALDQESNPRPFGLRASALTTEPNRPEQLILFEYYAAYFNLITIYEVYR